MALHPGFVTGAATTALDTRLAESGMFARNADGTVRAGALWVVGSALSIMSTNTSMKITIGPSLWVLSRTVSDGAVKVYNDGNVDVTIATAPGTNSRIDVLWVKQDDTTFGDADNLPVFGVTTGTAAASPSPSAIPSGAMQLATLLVPAGVTATNASGVVLTQTWVFTAMSGGIVPMRSTAEMTAWVPSADALARVIGLTSLVHRYNTSGVWVPMSASAYGRRTGAGAALASSTTATVLDLGSTTASNTTLVTTVTSAVQVAAVGLYRVTARVGWAIVAGGSRYLEVYVNGAPVTVPLCDERPAPARGQTLSGTLQLNAGDLVSLWGFQSSGSAVAYTTTLTVEHSAF